MRFGYSRVSTMDQHPEVQADRLTEAGCERIFTDKGVSGRQARRPEWDKCLDQLRAGDVLVTVRLDRIGRSVANLIQVVSKLGDLGVDLVVLDQAIDTSTPSGKLVFHVLSAIAEFERDLIRERTADGLAAARARGRRGGRKFALNESQRDTLRRMYDAAGEDGKAKFTVKEIAGALGVHRTTVYGYLKASGLGTGSAKGTRGKKAG